MRKLLTFYLHLPPILLAILAPLLLYSPLQAQAIEQVCELSDYQTPNGHAIWLDILPGAPNEEFVFDSLGGTLTIFDDSSAQITGRVFHPAMPNMQWDVNIWLINKRSFADWTALGRGVKVELAPPAVVAANQQNWFFFELDSTRSILTGVPGTTFDGDTLFLTHRPSTLEFGYQFGVGANAKNGNFGLSGWFNYSGSFTGVGDVNVNANCAPPVVCDVAIDSVNTNCINDSTFEVVVTFSGSNLYDLSDDQGTAVLAGVSAGTYSYGVYANGTNVTITVTDVDSANCQASAGPLSTDCTPPPVCDVAIDSLYTVCLNDTFFEVVVVISGSGTYDLSDDQGSPVLSGLSAGTYSYGIYTNGTQVKVFVNDPAIPNCMAMAGPVTDDCTPPPVCDVAIDSLITVCLNDSFFQVVVTISGSGSYTLSDDQGTPQLTGLSAGTYSYGIYANGTQVTVTVSDPAIANCQVMAGPITDDCTPPPMCDLSIDSVYTNCLNDSTFEVIISFSGTGTYELSDNQGTPAAPALIAGTYNFGNYPNNTPVVLLVRDLQIPFCQDTVGPITADCTPPCDVTIDSVNTNCLNDSTFEALVTFSGTGNQFEISDDQGTAILSGLTAGTYNYGAYGNGTQVNLTVIDMAVPNCDDTFGPVTDNCEPNPVCDVSLDSVFAQCKTDSTFELIVSISGSGIDYIISDDQGTTLLTGLSAGTHVYGEYFNSTDVFVTVSDPNFVNCQQTLGPVTADCTPVPVCDLVIDTAFASCLTDSTFEVIITFSGTGNFFQLFDNQGTAAIFGLNAGTYNYGVYTNGTQVNLSIIDFAIFNCFAETDTITEDCTGGGVFITPMLKANPMASDILLAWKSEGEYECLGYEVQRSMDGEQFETIAWLDGAGSTQLPQSYKFIDEDIQTNQTYHYRLHILDLDRRGRYSNTVQAVLTQENLFDVGFLRPNPTPDMAYAHVRSGRYMDLDWYMIDEAGRIVMRSTAALAPGSQDIKIPVRHLPAGIYFVKFELPTGSITRKLLVEPR